jgi:hypothetical protein
MMINFVQVITTLFLLLAGYTYLRQVNMVRKLERAVPHAYELFSDDLGIRGSFAALFFILAASSVLPLYVGPWDAILQMALFVLALFSFGFCISGLVRYSSIEFVIRRLGKIGLEECRKGYSENIFGYVDIFSEVIAKAIRSKSLQLSKVALRELLGLSEAFVPGEAAHGQKEGGSSLLDRVNFFVAHFSKRLGWLFRLALEEKMDPIAEEIITCYGKMSLFLATCHPTLIHMPLLFIARAADAAAPVGNEEVFVRAGATLSELGKSLVRVSQEKKESMKEAIFLVLSHLEEIMKESFKRNKELSPAILMQPFAEIAEMLAEEAYKDFPDREAVLTELRRCLAEFSALDLVREKAEESE